MKNFFKFHLLALLLASFVIGCDSGDEPQLTGDNTVYELKSKADPAISGTVTFAKRADNKTVITIKLNGTASGDSHPAHIHANTAAESGGIILDLTAVAGAGGESVTVVDKLNDGTAITYEELIEIDGYVNVHKSASELTTLIAQGDVGQNALTGDTKSYTLGSVSDPAISGTATFAKRKNNETLVTIQLTGTTSGGSHPAHIHANSAAQSGGIVIDLANVDGATGKGVTNVAKLNAGTAITYDELLNYSGYINVHLSSTSLTTLVAQGDIGANELTGTKKVYTLNAVGNSGISGTATFAERKSGFALVTIQLTGTTANGSHPSHIHGNNAATGGPIVKDLTTVNGATGKSATHIAALNDNTAITYAQLLTYNGYINVHQSSTDLATLVAQGNIGSNAP